MRYPIIIIMIITKDLIKKSSHQNYANVLTGCFHGQQILETFADLPTTGDACQWQTANQDIELSDIGTQISSVYTIGRRL